jgi:DHA1 family multidrug resistance protein-like MFS transporter/DHA1 family quinolone resistance protein-like MFS transporter
MEMQQRTDVVQFWVLNIASFFGQMSIAMVNLAVVYHLRLKFGLSAQMIGIAASVYTFTYLPWFRSK